MERPRRQHALWSALALLVFGAALASQCAPLWGRDPRVFVLVGRTQSEWATQAPAAGYNFTSSDRRFSVSLVAQNARAFVTRPLRLFAAETCAPAPRALALGHPGLALGLLGAPAWLLSGDPILSYNVAVGLLRLLAALAMFLLVRDWTGVPAAGIAAGLLYAFHLPSAAALTYPFIFDTTWTVFALFFAGRFAATGRWRDAIGLAICCGLQLLESFYALLASLLLALPLGVWLVLRTRSGSPRLAPALCAAGLLAVWAWAAFAPFVERTGAAGPSQVQFFASAAALLPGHTASGLAVVLAAAGLLLRPRREGAGDPRWALLVGALLVAWFATGGNETARLVALARGEPPPFGLPNPYRLLTGLLPGFAAVRAPGFALSGVGLALRALAGLGAAALLRRLPERLAPLAGLLLIATAWADVQSPHPLGLGPQLPLEAQRMRPEEDDLAFFAALAERDGGGPLLELPISLRVGPGGRGSAIFQVLLSSYHGRRTSGCYNSILPAETRELVPIAEALPQPEALDALRRLGFRTLVVYRARAPELAARLESAARDGRLRRLHADRSRSAYALPE